MTPVLMKGHPLITLTSLFFSPRMCHGNKEQGTQIFQNTQTELDYWKCSFQFKIISSISFPYQDLSVMKTALGQLALFGRVNYIIYHYCTNKVLCDLFLKMDRFKTNLEFLTLGLE